MRAAVRRAAAALVATLLSGAPHGLAAAFATEGEHRCQCASHGARHVCACPVCRARAREARRDATKALPPCHRRAALVELEQDERSERSPAPCLRPSCGADPELAAAPAASEVFTLPSAPALVVPHLGDHVPTERPAADDVVREPALPPPRPS